MTMTTNATTAKVAAAAAGVDETDPARQGGLVPPRRRDRGSPAARLARELAIRDIEDKRARARDKDRGKPANQRTAPPRLVEGATVQGWRAALNQLELLYPDRLAGRIN